MSDAVNIRRSVDRVNVSPQFPSYSKVIINIDDDTCVEYGTDTGRTLEITCPWGTEQMAQNILSSLSGWQYQPMNAEGALLDPAAELGDGVTIDNVYSGLYRVDTDYSKLMRSDIEAPCDEEIDHEYPYQTPTERKITRQSLQFQSQFDVQASQIQARVSKIGGDSSSFGWSLTDDGFIMYSGNQAVFRADEDGLQIRGRINVTSGTIGDDSNGFTIGSYAIYNGMTSFSDTNHDGVYIGTDGISLGRGAFKVDSLGNLTATSGTFTGAVYANMIQSGGDAGYIEESQIGSGAVTGSKIRGGAVGRNKVDSGLDNDVGEGESAYANQQSTSSGAISTKNLYSLNHDTQVLKVRGTQYSQKTATISGVTITYLGI